MGFEIIETPQAMSPKGSFIPRADQTKFRSAFYPEDAGTETHVMSQDGRARLGFKEWVSEGTAKNRNIVKPQMMQTRFKEYFVPIEDALEFEKYAGAISSGKVDDYLKNRNRPASAEQIGIVSGGEQRLETVFATKT